MAWKTRTVSVGVNCNANDKSIYRDSLLRVRNDKQKQATAKAKCGGLSTAAAKCGPPPVEMTALVGVLRGAEATATGWVASGRVGIR